MSGTRPKPSIPAWQRAPITPPTEDPVYSQSKDAGVTSTDASGAEPHSSVTWQKEPSTPATEDPVYSQPKSDADTTVEKLDTTPASTPTEQQASTVPPSEDPVYSQSTDTSTSDVSAESQPSITETASSRSSPADAAQTNSKSYISDFQKSSTTQVASRAPQAQATTTFAAPPPIITYPEFLVRAHRPPPLITPTRIFNALYLAGGLAALLYGTSQYLVEPMVASLSESRHDFYTHSQSKVDELNERLSKLVSKVPAGKKEPGVEDNKDAEDAESVTSDPTELYHRDMGTQTDIDPPSGAAASSSAGKTAAAESAHEAALAHDAKALAAIEAHLTEILESSNTNAETAQRRVESINKLRHYLDQLCYAGAGINVWTGNEDRANGGAGGSKSEDAIESLKKEIRSVKGVLLSAKRFPSYAAGGRPGAVAAGAS